MRVVALGAVPPDVPEDAPADAEMLRRANAGDEASARVLVARYGPRLGRIVEAAYGDRGLAEDVVQETFLRAIDQAHQLRDDAGLLAWLVRIALRLAADSKRKRRRETLPGELPDHASASSPEGTLAAAQDALAVRAALDKLSERWRTLLVLRYFSGFSTQEIAEITGKKEPAIRKDLERARARMKKLLARWFEEHR